DHETTGADIADRAFMSRFHFDRVLSAVAGESPARFRRRVLLERAAYRLTTSNSSVLDVAVEAGYGSHEAFTRAFAKAHGVNPSEWRRRARPFFIDAPSGVHFHPPAGLRLPARGKVIGMDVLVKMVDHHIWLVGEMISAAGRLDDASLDRVIEISVEGFDDEPSIRHLLDRMVWQLEMWLAAVDDDPFEVPESARDVALSVLRERHADAGSRFLSLVTRLNEQGRFDETFVSTMCDPPEVFTFGGMVSHVLTFAAHRRALVICAFHAAGFTELGYGDPMHFVARA
ncbi:MAG TPA: AraC family transcriptional regulator, partial [Micromonosporaceae bacterium]|nr:AraC family transcriptional regulator [Micromonosporaceae bacterium]